MPASVIFPNQKYIYVCPQGKTVITPKALCDVALTPLCSLGYNLDTTAILFCSPLQYLSALAYTILSPHDSLPFAPLSKTPTFLVTITPIFRIPCKVVSSKKTAPTLSFYDCPMYLLDLSIPSVSSHKTSAQAGQACS